MPAGTHPRPAGPRAIRDGVSEWQIADTSPLDRQSAGGSTSSTRLQQERRTSSATCNADFDYRDLFRFLAFPINNVGDPFVPSNFHLNTHAFECEVLDAFRGVDHRKRRRCLGVCNRRHRRQHVRDLLGRELFPDGLVYYSEDTHYSVSKDPPLPAVRNIMIRARGRADRPGGPAGDDPHPPRRAADRLRQRRNHDEGGDRRDRRNPAEIFRRPGDPLALHPRRRRASG